MIMTILALIGGLVCLGLLGFVLYVLYNYVRAVYYLGFKSVLIQVLFYSKHFRKRYALYLDSSKPNTPYGRPVYCKRKRED